MLHHDDHYPAMHQCMHCCTTAISPWEDYCSDQCDQEANTKTSPDGTRYWSKRTTHGEEWCFWFVDGRELELSVERDDHTEQLVLELVQRAVGL